MTNTKSAKIEKTEKKFDIKEFVQFNDYYDYNLLFLTIFMVSFGLVMIYSSSSYNALKETGDSMTYVKTQFIAIILGIFVMLFVSMIDYKKYLEGMAKTKIPRLVVLYIVCVILQIYVLFFGVESHGQRRWINLGFTTFQPSELTKIAVILFTAYLVSRAPRMLDGIIGFMIIFAANLFAIVPIVVNNLSTGLIVIAIVAGVCFVASRKSGYFVVSLIVGIIAILLYLVVLSDGYRNERFQIWLNVEDHPKGYQILQGLYAIASGGMFGVGLGESKQKLGFIPEAHNDMIFTVICEELGIFGAISVVALFIFLLYRIFVIAINAPDLFSSLMCVGVFVHIGFQVLVNIAVVTNSIPSTGVPLPFISYGGTSVTILMLEIGMVLGVSNRIKQNDTKEASN